MLIHIVCWKYREDTDETKRELHRSKLLALPTLIPNIVSFDVGADILHLDRSFDTGLVAVFGDREALDEYTVHAEHLKVAAFGKEIAEKVVSVDFFN